MTTEAELRKKLAEIDELRREAKVCERMHAHWIGFEGEFVEVRQTTVQRRWWRDKQVHSEHVMTGDERELFRHWLTTRAYQLNHAADKLADSLKGAADV